MEKIDRLGWAAGISLRAYGRLIGVRVNDPRALETLLPRFPFGWKQSDAAVVDRLYSLYIAAESPRAAVRRYHLLYADVQRAARDTDIGQVLDRLESDMRLYVAEYARRRVFIHAGVVGWRGMAILAPGRSLSGKSTLIAELVRAGATYYSDEYAVLDGQGRVHPFRKPLSIREQGKTGPQTHYPVEAFGGRNGSRPLPLGLVVVSHYKEGARWRPKRLSAGQGVLELLANSVGVRNQPEATLATLHRALSTASVLKGARGEARDTAQSILQLPHSTK